MALTIEYYCKDMLTSTIRVDFGRHKINAVNHTDNLLHTAFGRQAQPSWDSFERFLQSRCFPKERKDCKYLLSQLGLMEYDPLAICEKTNGRMDGDFFSMRFIWDA